ncbi:MAG: hypothetical protein KF856_16560 [Cyclobacteriaceae bacterium]|nr:hypothetical protein [Cyclobacteriaceae bacterium]
MKKLIPILLLLSTIASGQTHRVFSVLEEPQFATVEDSIRYAQVNQAIRKAMELKTELNDSLFTEFQLLRSRITGYRSIYNSTTGFITLDSLAHISDKSAIKTLSINNWKSRKLPTAVYACTNLQELELVNTRIKKVKQLKKLPKLTELYVLNNQPKGKFTVSKTKTLRTMVMRGNKPALPRSFAPLVALQRLDLAANRLTNFPAGLSRNKNLKELVLSNNAISNLDQVQVLPALEKLELIRNKVEVIPESIKNLNGLKQLSLNYNSIQSVHPAIANLTRLEQLSFYNNKLKAIPEGIYDLPALREIDLYHNEIERVPDRIANLKKLEILYLSHNKLISVTEAIGSLSNLNELYLSDNRLVEIPASLQQLTNLKVLRVNNNRLVITPKSVSSLSLLENLDISGNQLNEIPEGLDNLPALKILVMLNNPWDEPTRKQIAAVTQTLRNKEVVVHVEEELGIRN